MIPPYTKTMPAWYQISCQGDGTALGIKIHRLALQELTKIKWSATPLVKDIFERFKFEGFTAPREGDCGFCDVLKHAGSDESWVSWQVSLPVFKALDEGTESPRGYDVAIRATLNSFLCLCLRHFEGDTSQAIPQLIILDGLSLRRADNWRNSGSISAALTPAAVQWLNHIPEEGHIEPIVQMMKTAYCQMWYRESMDIYRFDAMYRKPKWLSLCVPGDACRLDPDGYHDKSLDRGYEMHPHNVDTGLQQLTLLMGLAKLHDMIMDR